jgi:colanic acid biosynthesis glycosyl transferase WcaI
VKILMHDMHGYIFVRDLASRLSNRGHLLTFVTCGSVQTPNQQSSRDAQGASTVVVDLPHSFPKYDILRRPWAEVDYGRRIAKVIHREKPDIVVSSNGPLLSQMVMARAARQTGAHFAFWLQDMYGPAVADALPDSLPEWLRRCLASPFILAERALLRSVDHVIVIGERLEIAVRGSGVPTDRITLLNNWTDPGPYGSPSSNTVWRKEQGFEDQLIFLYAGTLGKKHPYKQLPSLARILRDQIPTAQLVVVSEGLGAEWLRDKVRHDNGLVLLPYQPERCLPDMLASADAVVLTLSERASRYSVPSKLYTYMCARRPVLALVPAGSESADLIREADCGIVADEKSDESVENGVRQLTASLDVRQRLGGNGRLWAEENLNVEKITDRFEEILSRVGQRSKE